MGLLDKMRSGASARTPVAKSKYGLDQAAELLRSLPTENFELVITVVKKTLQSFNVDVGQIVIDAKGRLTKIENEIDSCEAEIEKFKKEVEDREETIKALKEKFEETKMIKEHLEEVLDSTEAPIPEEFLKPKSKETHESKTASGVKKADSSVTQAQDTKETADGEEPPKSKSAFFKRKGS